METWKHSIQAADPLFVRPPRQLHLGWWQHFGKADVGKWVKFGELELNWPGSSEPRQVLISSSVLGSKGKQSDDISVRSWPWTNLGLERSIQRKVARPRLSTTLVAS